MPTWYKTRHLGCFIVTLPRLSQKYLTRSSEIENEEILDKTVRTGEQEYLLTIILPIHCSLGGSGAVVDVAAQP